ncbi:MAG TPA: DUF192 domain-containing protein [Bryobacteraceae bacterium]|nr:DUF192 domain-containing protein [Bryobacteraceae bacterium]
MRYAALLACLLFASCNKPQDPGDFNTTDLTLPGGQVIKVETMIRQLDLGRGLKYRPSLAPDHGMLFVHYTPGYYRYWMYQILVPLDIIWLDSDRKIVQMVLSVQPCGADPNACPQYGSARPAHYVVELAGGTAKKYHLQVGQQLNW